MYFTVQTNYDFNVFSWKNSYTCVYPCIIKILHFKTYSEPNNSLISFISTIRIINHWKILYPLTRKIPDDFKILVIIHSWRCWSFLLVLMRNVLWICICFIYIFLVYVMIQWELHFKFFFCYLYIIFFLC